jgi:hypothetical protein
MRECVFFLLIIIIIWLLIEYVFWKENKKFNRCVKNKTHNFEFSHNSRGNTGDLGFGIKGFWNVDYYKCSNCGKEKKIEKH